MEIDRPTAEEIQEALEDVIVNLSGGKRYPIRFERIAQVFDGRENDEVSLDELAIRFEGTDDPRKSAAGAVSALNRELEGQGKALRLKSKVVYYFDRP